CRGTDARRIQCGRRHRLLAAPRYLGQQGFLRRGRDRTVTISGGRRYIDAMITLQPIGIVHSGRSEMRDDGWDDVPASIELNAEFSDEALLGLEDFSHAEIIFHLDRIPESMIERGALHPRGNPNWPRVGIFAQRAKKRPSRLGATIVRILGREGRTLR